MIPPPAGGRFVSHGIDLVDVSRVERSIDRHAERFLTRVFSDPERSYCEASKRRAEHYAARFAAKEAVFKAIGTGWAQGVTWLDVAVTRHRSGLPGIELSGRAAVIAEELGITSWSLSLSHAGGFAMASAVALAGDDSSRWRCGDATGCDSRE